MAKQELTLRQLQEIAYDIGNRMEATVEEKRDKKGPEYHSDANRASEIDHPCERFLVYARTRWEERKQKDVRTIARLNAGTAMEEEVEAWLLKSGYKVTLQQKSTTWDKYRITGKIDGSITGPDRRSWPIEIFSVMPWFWDSTRSVDEIKRHPKHWIRRKAAQLNVYLVLEEQEGGFLIIGSFGKLPRVLPMLLDFDMAERHVQKCIRVNEHVEAGTLPDRIEYASDVCGMCDFDHICMPLQFASNIREISMADYAKLRRYLELRPAVQEYSELENKLIGSKDSPGTFFESNAIHRDIEIATTTWGTKVLRMPPAVKQLMNRKYQQTVRASRTTINYIGGGENE